MNLLVFLFNNLLNTSSHNTCTAAVDKCVHTSLQSKFGAAWIQAMRAVTFDGHLIVDVCTSSRVCSMTIVSISFTQTAAAMPINSDGIARTAAAT